MKDAADGDDSGGYDKDFIKQTILKQEAQFRNQVQELHRLYNIQRNLIDELKGKNLNEDMTMSDDHSGDKAGKRKLSGSFLPNSTYGEGSSSSGRLQNGVSSKDGDARKVGRRMIDLQLPADHEASVTGENTICPPFSFQQSGGDASASASASASRRSISSGSCLDVKTSNGLADLNEPLKWQDSELVPLLPMDMYSHYVRNNTGAQGQWLERNRSQNGSMFLEAGHDRTTRRDQLHMPSHSVQGLPNYAFQPQSYPTPNHSRVNFSGERAYLEMEARSKNPQVSYDSYVASSVASNAPRSHNNYPPRPWSHDSSSWENPMSSSHQNPYPVQTNSFMNFNTHARPGSSFEMRSHLSNGPYQGFSSGTKQSFLNFPSNSSNPNASFGEVGKSQSFATLQRQKKQECSPGFSWLTPKPPYKSGTSNSFFDLNVSTNQFMNGAGIGDNLTSASSQKGLPSASHSNYINMGRVEMTNPWSSTNITGRTIFGDQFSFEQEHTSSIIDQLKEAHNLVKRDLDINLPYEASGSVVKQHGAKAFCVNKKEEKKIAKTRPFIALNSFVGEGDEDSGLHSSLRVKTKARTWLDLESPPLESEEEGKSLQRKTNEENWGLMIQGQDGDSMDELIKTAAEAIVAMSSSDLQRHPDDAASSSTDAAAKSPLSWFADLIITSCSAELESKVDDSPEAAVFEGYREEYSSGEIDYFEAMTLNIQETKEEDYMPKPLVPENLKLEETAVNKPRRGQARRGRPKRDFQRDILSGLPSLSRHEVTEDIQMFGGLMKTVGDDSWDSGVAPRRNPKRKRVVNNKNQAPVCPSMVQQPVNESVAVMGLEDSNLTGWGPTTRRARRQRCASTSVVLT